MQVTVFVTDMQWQYVGDSFFCNYAGGSLCCNYAGYIFCSALFI